MLFDKMFFRFIENAPVVGRVDSLRVTRRFIEILILYFRQRVNWFKAEMYKQLLDVMGCSYRRFSEVLIPDYQNSSETKTPR